MNTSGRTVEPDPPGGRRCATRSRRSSTTRAELARPRSGRGPRAPFASYVARRPRARLGARAGRAAASLAGAREDKVHLVAIPLLTLPFLPLLLLVAAVLRGRSCASTRSATRRRTSSPTRSASRCWPRSRITSSRTRSRRSATSSRARFRRMTLGVILFYLDYATRHFFNRGNLAGREDDPLRALGLHRRQAAHVLREQLRRQPRELHGRLHRQGRLGAEPRLQQRRRLPADELARAAAARRTSSRSRTTCARTRCRRASGTRPTTG